MSIGQLALLLLPLTALNKGAIGKRASIVCACLFLFAYVCVGKLIKLKHLVQTRKNMVIVNGDKSWN
jgi:uncharacterized membrane protein